MPSSNNCISPGIAAKISFMAVLLLIAAGQARPQFRFTAHTASIALNTNNRLLSTVQVNTTSNSFNTFNNNINDIIKVVVPPAYTTSVQISYGIPGITFFDWLNMHNAALAVLSYGPGSGDNTNYLPGDVATLNSLAYGSYLNPSDYGTRTLQINIQQWNGNLNWYSSTAGGGQFVKNHITWFMPIQGKLLMRIN